MAITAPSEQPVTQTLSLLVSAIVYITNHQLRCHRFQMHNFNQCIFGSGCSLPFATVSCAFRSSVMRCMHCSVSRFRTTPTGGLNDAKPLNPKRKPFITATAEAKASQLVQLKLGCCSGGFL